MCLYPNKPFSQNYKKNEYSAYNSHVHHVGGTYNQAVIRNHHNLIRLVLLNQIFYPRSKISNFNVFDHRKLLFEN